MSETGEARSSSEIADDVDMEEEYLLDGSAEDPLARFRSSIHSSSDDPDSIEEMMEQIPVKNSEFDITRRKWPGRTYPESE